MESRRTAGCSGLNISQRIVTLHIMYSSDLLKMKTPCSESFASIYRKVAHRFNVKASEIILYYHDRPISIHHTPLILNMNANAHVDCFENKIKFRTDFILLNCMMLILRSSYPVKECIFFQVHQLETVTEIKQRYAKRHNIVSCLLKFQCNGKVMLSFETPYDLKMQDGNCIDVTYSDYPETICLTDSD